MIKLVLYSSGLRDDSKDIILRSLSNDVEAVEFTPDTTIVSLGSKLSHTTHIAIMYHSHEHESNILFPQEEISGIWYDSEFITLLETVKGSGVIIDLLSCNLKEQAFKDEMLRLSSEYEVTIRYSLDETGNTPNGDWILESHNVDAKALYFTETISEFDETLLFLMYPYQEMFPFNLDVNEEFAHHHKDYDGNVIDTIYTIDGNLIQFPPSSIYSDVTGYDATFTNAVALVHNGSAGCALLDDGTIHVWGNSSKGGSLTSDQISLCNNIVSLYPAIYGFVAKRQDGSFIMWGNNMFHDSSSQSNTYKQLISEYATQLDGSSIKMAIPANHSNNVFWGFYFVKTNGTFVECLLSVSPPNTSPNNTIPDDIYNEGFFLPTEYKTALEDETDPIVHVESCNNYGMAVLKESGSLYIWGRLISGKKQFREGVKSIKRNVAGFAWIYTDGTMESDGGSGVKASVSVANTKLAQQNGSVSLQQGEAFVSIDYRLHSYVACTNMGRFVTLGDGRTTWGLHNMTGNKRLSFNSALESEGIKQMYAGEAYVIFLTNDNNVFSYGINNTIRSAVGLNIQYVVPISGGRSGNPSSQRHIMVDSEGQAYMFDHTNGTITTIGPTGLQGVGRVQNFNIYGIYSDGSVLNLQNGSAVSALQDSVYIYTNFVNTRMFALINNDQSIQRGIKYTQTAVSSSGGGGGGGEPEDTFSIVNLTYSSSGLSATQSDISNTTDISIIETAAQKWESVITSLPGFMGGNKIEIDLKFDSSLDESVYGSTAVNSFRGTGTALGTQLPSSVTIRLNSNQWDTLKSTSKDDNNSTAYYMVLHEFGHALGIGSVWDNINDSSVYSTDNTSGDKFYAGINGNQEYRKVLGLSESNDDYFLPITANIAHLEEGDDITYKAGIKHVGLDHELMSEYIESDSRPDPLSRITVGLLEDLGFGVNYDNSDTFSLFVIQRNNGFLQVKGAVAGSNSGGTAVSELRTIYFYDDDGTGNTPSYSGNDWPYVQKRTNDTYHILGGLNLTISFTDSGQLKVNNRLAYFYSSDSTSDSSAGSNVAKWNLFTNEFLSETQRFGGLTLTEFETNIVLPESLSASNGRVVMDASMFGSPLQTKEGFNTASDKRTRLRKAVELLKQSVVNRGIALGSTNRIRVQRASLPFADVFQRSFFQVADNNVTVNLSDIGSDGVYASLETENTFLRVNTPNSYVIITNTGSNTFSLNLGGTTTAVSEGETGVHDGFRYYVGSGSGEPANIPICFLKGVQIPMADGSYKVVEEIQKGDLVKTESGSGEVITTQHWELPLNEQTQPVQIGDNLVLSKTHKVRIYDKFMNAKAVGVPYKVNSNTVEYYHFQTRNWKTDFVPFSDSVSAEVWDGLEWNAPVSLQSKVLWMKLKDSPELYKYTRVE